MSDSDTPNENPREARELVRSAVTATLATLLDQDGDTWPFASLVLMAHDQRGRPLLFLSDLAEHSRNLGSDNRATLLVAPLAAAPEPLAEARLSIMGHVERTEDTRMCERFLNRHPGARMYAGLSDFRLYCMTPERAHMVAGFGHVAWLPGEDLILPELADDTFPDAEASMIAHMNEDHSEAVAAMAEHFLGLQGNRTLLIGVDTEGIDLRADAEVRRIRFETPAENAREARAQLVRLTRQSQS